VFVDIKIDVQHFIDTIKFNFPDANTKLVLVGTIQFASSLYAAKQELIGYYTNISVPQARPLSPGRQIFFRWLI
jgi:2-(3-amino-3-carboxypropyl)histidine synthase